MGLLKDEPYKYYINKICALATKGSIKAMKVLEADLPEIVTKDDFQLIVEAIGSLVTCYVKRDLSAEKMSDMDPYFDQAYRIATSNRERSAILNQKQRMFAATKQFEEAKKLAEQMVQLYDEEPAYFFNYATILEELDDYDGAKEKIKKCVELSTNSESHEDALMLACKLFKHSSIDNDKLFYNECLSKLEQINPYKARLLRFEQ